MSPRVADQRIPAGTRWGPIADALGSRNLWLWLAVVEAFLSLLSQVPEDVRRPPLNLAAGLLSSGALLAVICIGWVLVLSRLHGGARVIAAVPILVLAALARGITLQALQVSWGMSAADPALYGYRIMNSLFVVLVGTSVGVLVKVGVDRNRRRLVQLEREQERLTLLLGQAQAELRVGQRGATSAVCADLVEHLADVPTASPTDAVESLHQVADEVVRPLSHELAATVPTWRPPEPVTSEQLDWRRVWDRMASPRSIEPFGPAVCTLLVMPASAVVKGLSTAVVLHVVAALLIFAGLWLIRCAAPAVPDGRPTIVRLAGTTALIVLACVPAAVFTLLYPEPGEFAVNAVYAIVVVPLAALLFSFLRAARLQQLQIDADLNAVLSDTRWWVARTRMQAWWQNGALARALHGPVQTIIHAAAGRLRSAVDQGAATPEFARSVLGDTQAALADVVMREEVSGDARTDLAMLATTWLPLVRIDYDLPDPVAAQLDSDPVCAEIAMDIVGEAVSNAVRHGGARYLQVAVDVPGRREVLLSVLDDGRGWDLDDDPDHPGLGRTQLDTCAVAWRYERADGGHRLWVELPFLPSRGR